MARKELFTDVFETDTFDQWRLKTNSIKLNLQDMFDEIDAFPNIAVMLVGDQTVDGVKSYLKKSNWTKEYTQNQVTPLLELKVTNSMSAGSNLGHQGSGPAIDFYNPDTTGGSDNTHLVSRIASITERTGDIFPDASLVFFTGKNTGIPLERMRINSNGQVGIGTSSPNAGVQLSVQTSNNDSIISIQSKDNKFAGVTFGDDKSHRSGQIQYHNIGNSMRFFTGEALGGNSAERLRITSTGRVGIGITKPTAKLDVSGNIKSTTTTNSGIAAVQLNSTDGSIEIIRPVALGGNSGPFIDFKENPNHDFDCRIQQTEDDGLGFSTGGNGQSSRRVTILKDGNVGIGITSPTSKLHVNGKVNITGRLGVLDVENPDYALCVGARSDEPGHVALNAAGGAISLRPTANTTHAWLINAFDSPGGSLAITSRKRNTSTNRYEDTNALVFRSNASIDIPNNLTIGKTTKSNQVLIRDTWNANGPAGGNVLYIKDLDKHSSYDPHGNGDNNNNYLLDKSAFPLIISDNNNSTSGPNSHGIVLYNASGTPGSFAPSILFASREAGPTNFRSATAGIYSRSPLNIGGVLGATGENNTNYNDGELIFATSGTLSDGTTNSQGVTQRMVIDRTGKVGIGLSAPTTTLDVAGDIKGSGDLFIGHDDLPQIVISDGSDINTEFAIFHNGTQNKLEIGPKNSRGTRRMPAGALRITRFAKVEIPFGGLVNDVLNDDNSLVNKKYVDDSVAAADQFGSLTTLSLNRNDTDLEGGQLILNRASDNTAYWNIDAHGSTSTPSLRFFHENDGAAATVSMHITSSDKVGIREADPDWDLCIGGKSTDAGSVCINAEGGAISLRPLKNTTHAWMFNAFDSTGGNAAIASRFYDTNRGRYRDTNILTFTKDGDATAKRKITAGAGIVAGADVSAGGNVYTAYDVHYGSGSTGWVNHARQNNNGDFYEIASRKSDDSDWNWGYGFRQYKSGFVNIGGDGEKTGYKLYVDGNILLKKDADIIQEGRTTPNNWGGGLTTFDVYADGGTLGVGKDGSLECYFNRDGNGFVKNSLELGYTPTKKSHAVRKDYVDSQISSFITTTKNTFSGRTDFDHSGTAFGYTKSHAGNRIPGLTGDAAHGRGFVSKFTTTSSTDGGGILIDVSDNNSDECAISAYNVNATIDKEIFHVRATNGDMYSSGTFYNRGNIGTEGRIHIGKTDDYHYISKHSSDGLQIGYTKASGSTTGLRIRENGTVALGKTGTANGDLVNKKYVDDKVTAVTNSVQGNYKIVSGRSYAVGYTNVVGSWKNTSNYFDVYPPSGYKMSDLEAFLPSIHVIHFAGGVNGDDSIRCTHSILSDRIRVYVQNTEQRSKPAANYIAVWNR